MRPDRCTGVAIITGGTSGIGLATAELFARNGWRVGLIARSRPGLDAAVATLARIGAVAWGQVADVADAVALDTAAQHIVDRLGPLSAWVNAAGCGVFGRLGQVPPRAFDQVTATSYTGTVNGVRTALRLLPQGGPGAVINICSAMAFRGLPGLASYAGAKAAVRGFTESVQAELALAHSQVRLSLVYPPAVNTPFFTHAVSYLDRPPRPAKPVYQPELVAQAVLHAVHSGRATVRVSFVSVAYDLGCRFAPDLVRRAIIRLGYDGQMTDLPQAQARDPSLFHPPLQLSGTRGPFPARAVSTQLWLLRHGIGATALAATALAATALALGAVLARSTRPRSTRSRSTRERLGRPPDARG